MEYTKLTFKYAWISSIGRPLVFLMPVRVSMLVIYFSSSDNTNEAYGIKIKLHITTDPN